MATESLVVDADDGTYNQWTKYGTGPLYLDDDETANYIGTATAGYSEGWYSFPPTTFTTITAVVFKEKSKVGAAGGDDLATIHMSDGSTEDVSEAVAPTTTSFAEYPHDYTSFLNTVAKVNAAKFYVTYVKMGTKATAIHITYGYLYVTGEGGGGPSLKMPVAMYHRRLQKISITPFSKRFPTLPVRRF